jgi:hypothetical protein
MHAPRRARQRFTGESSGASRDTGEAFQNIKADEGKEFHHYQRIESATVIQELLCR